MNSESSLNTGSGFSATSSSIRQNLLNRANRIVEQYNLPVPRSCTLSSVNYHFWSAVFNRVFGIRCNPLARSREEHIGHLKACLNMLQIVLEIPVSHIQADRLLEQDLCSMQNLLEIVELSGNRRSLPTPAPLAIPQPKPVVNVNNTPRRHLAGVDLNVPAAAEHIDHHHHLRVDVVPVLNEALHHQVQTTNTGSKGLELAEKLDKSLKNQILAMEIEKKVKMYLGDVSVAKESQKQHPHVRATRQSIVRTRSIQPSGLTAFDSTSNSNTSSNSSSSNILSVDLLRLFPEIANEEEVLGKIQSQEKHLLMSERQIQLWAAEKADRSLNRLLKETIDHQRQRLAQQEKEALQELEKNQQQRKPQLSAQALQRRERKEKRHQQATLQKEIEDFHQQSTAAYLSARSTMESILVQEFKKVDARQRQQISEIRKYLANYYEVETDKLRVLLDNFDEM